MKTIIVCVDFSANSDNAAAFAGNLAAFYGAGIWLYHAYQIPIALSEFAYPVADVAEMQKAAEKELDSMKKNIQGKLPANVTINTKTEMNVLEVGLINLCDDIQPDMVVMSLSGKDRLNRLIAGSNTIKAINELTYPILVVPPKAEFVPVRKIGFACDYEQVEKSTPLSLLKKIVRDFNAELHVLNIDGSKRTADEEKRKETHIIYELLQDVKAEYHHIDNSDVTEGINWFTDKEKLDWLMVIPKKHGLMDKIFRRSHTKELLHHTHVPVLCIHE